MTNGAGIFISYRRENGGDAGRLSDWLASSFGDGAVFLDRTGIRGGQDFPDVLAQAVRECTAVVVVVTADWHEELVNADDWMRRELQDALAADRAIVPVLIEGAPAPQRAQLPIELAPLADKHAMVVSHGDYRDDVGKLIEALRAIGVPLRVEQAFPERPRSSDRAEERSAWYSRLTPEEVRVGLGGALGAHKIRISGEDGDSFVLRGGSKFWTRVLGGLTGPESRLPVTGRLRISDRRAGVTIEVMLSEDWGAGVFTGLGGRYASHFANTIADLRRSTGAPAVTGGDY